MGSVFFRVPIHVLEKEHIINASLEECWRFFSDPRNLARLTPRSLDFRVLTGDLPQEIHPGLMIRYRVRPLAGISVTWLAEITQVEPGRYFVDEQRAGPYRLWHHEHFFEDAGEGRTRCRDRVHYVLPLPWLAEPVHRWIVRPALERIFSFREEAVRERFPEDG